MFEKEKKVNKLSQEKSHFFKIFFLITTTKQGISSRTTMSITLLSSDGEKIVMSQNAAALSINLGDLIGDLGDSEMEIPVKVQMKYLKLVVQWMERNKDVEEYQRPKGPIKPEEGNVKLPIPTAADDAMTDALGDDDKVAMILAANVMDIKPLLDILCISVSNMVKGQSPEDMRKSLIRTDKPVPSDLADGIPGLKTTATTSEAIPTVEEIVKGEPINGEKEEGESSKRKPIEGEPADDEKEDGDSSKRKR